MHGKEARFWELFRRYQELRAQKMARVENRASARAIPSQEDKAMSTDRAA